MTKYFGNSKLTQETLDKINQDIRETINNFYRNHDAESFFKIVGISDFCSSEGLTREEIPQLIEMKNIIVMG